LGFVDCAGVRVTKIEFADINGARVAMWTLHRDRGAAMKE
jgi:hypothetical protein